MRPGFASRLLHKTALCSTLDHAELVQAAYEVGMELLTDGRLKEAVVQFAITANGMSVRTQLGGEARLQKAICLDSLVSLRDRVEQDHLNLCCG